MQFTTDWASANNQDWDSLCKELKPKTYLEVGSFEGRSAVGMIERGGLEEMVCIDPWKDYSQIPDVDMEQVEKRFDANVAEAMLKVMGEDRKPPLLKKYKDNSNRTLAGLLWDAHRTEGFDLVYIDGSHMPEDVMLDMMLAIRLVRIGGVMIVDDYLWTIDAKGDDLLDTPRMAIDFFGLVMRRYVSDIPRMSLYQRFYQKMKRVP